MNQKLEVMETYMHVKSINTQVVGSQLDTVKDLLQSQVFAITKQDHFIWALFNLALDEAKQMLLVHARRMVNVSIYLSHVVKVSVGYSLSAVSMAVEARAGLANL